MAEYILPPSLVPNLIDWTLIDYSGTQISPLSGAIRTVSRGQRWQAHFQFHDLIGDDRNCLSALMARMRGKANRVWVPDPSYRQAGSFPAPEMLTNGDFRQGTTGWSLNGAATMAAYNRQLALTATSTTAVSISQQVTVVAARAYAMRALLVDGKASTASILGPQFADNVTVFPNVGLSRGLITASAQAINGGAANEFPVAVSSGISPGMSVIVTYASLRRCALVDNTGNLTYFTSIPVWALPVSTNGLLRAGDRCEINGEMKTVTFDLNSDAAGGGTLYFEPALRKLAPTNSPVIIGQPMMRGILTNNAMQVSRPGQPTPFSDFDFTFIEG